MHYDDSEPEGKDDDYGFLLDEVIKINYDL